MHLKRHPLRFAFLAAGLALTALHGCSVIVDGKIEPEVDGGPDCRGLVDFEDCPGHEGERSLMCLGGLCVASSCGDQIVDRRSDPETEEPYEECDPATPETGCQGCRWVCTSDEDCADGEFCTGEETCDLATHRCSGGIGPASGTACTTAESEAGTCEEFVCVPSVSD